MHGVKEYHDEGFLDETCGGLIDRARAAGCTTSGVGTGQVVGQNIGAIFIWTENGGTRGTMVAQPSNGEVFQGPLFQITPESRSWIMVRCGTVGARLRLGPSASAAVLGWGWGGWGPWGPMDTITHYSGQVLANLQGPGGFMRCHFSLMLPSYGMAGGGLGQCQLPTGTIINAEFPPHRGSTERGRVPGLRSGAVPWETGPWRPR